MIRALFRKNPAAEAADMLYLAVAGAARNPALFAACGVPDTVEGRFEALAAHVFLVARRLEAAGTDGAPLAQAFIDRFFADLDNAVRAIGIGDLSVGKKVKAYAKAFYGRVEAYPPGSPAPTRKCCNRLCGAICSARTLRRAPRGKSSPATSPLQTSACPQCRWRR